jgi:hypothetical protein
MLKYALYLRDKAIEIRKPNSIESTINTAMAVQVGDIISYSTNEDGKPVERKHFVKDIWHVDGEPIPRLCLSNYFGYRDNTEDDLEIVVLPHFKGSRKSRKRLVKNDILIRE